MATKKELEELAKVAKKQQTLKQKEEEKKQLD